MGPGHEGLTAAFDFVREIDTDPDLAATRIAGDADQPPAAEQPPRPSPESLHCSFCGNPRSKVRSMVFGATPDIAICDECIDLCSEIIADQLGQSPAGEPPPN